MFPVSLSEFQPYLMPPPPLDPLRSVSAPPSISPLMWPALNLNASTLSSLSGLGPLSTLSLADVPSPLPAVRKAPPPPPPPPPRSLSTPPPPLSTSSSSSASASSSSTTRGRTQRALSVDEDDDDDLNIDTSNMTQEEKNEVKAQRKARKMNREKLKRSRVNDQFDHLCRVLHVGKTTRVEKLTVLNETLRTLYQLKAENRILKEQTRQMKELLARRNSTGEQGSPPNGNQPQERPPEKRSSGKERGNRQKQQAGLPPLEPVVGVLPPKEESFLVDMEIPAVKQEMMCMGDKVFFGKHDSMLPRQVPDEQSMLAFNMMFEQPSPNDLDFAFGGDNNFAWMKPPIQGVDGMPRYEPECDFNPFVLPKPEHDSMDLFLAAADDPCDDLLC